MRKARKAYWLQQTRLFRAMVKRIELGMNPGDTTLILRELWEKK